MVDLDNSTDRWITGIESFVEQDGFAAEIRVEVMVMSRDMRSLGWAGVFLLVLGSCSLLGWAQEETQQAFDYDDYAEVLRTHINGKGLVDYKQLKTNPERLLSYIDAIARLPRSRYEKWDEQARMAFWINAYNGLTLKAIIDNYPIKASFWRSRLYPKNSIRQISGVWDGIEFAVMGRKLTLEHIEHKILRAQFNEPKIHVALVCAALGCPVLRNEPYVGSQLEEQLDDQARQFLGDRRKFRIDRSRDVVYLSPIFKWFGKDFVRTYALAERLGRHDGQTSAVLNFVTGYLDETDMRYVRAGSFKVKYLDYDWSLNEQRD
jgi:hypothetical protein